MLDAAEPLNPKMGSDSSEGDRLNRSSAPGADSPSACVDYNSCGGIASSRTIPPRLEFLKDVREMTDAAQSMDVACVHLDKMQFFYVSTLMFALPILYSIADQIWGQTTPTFGYFDGCRLSDGSTGTFDACVACNGGGTNLVNLSPTQAYGVDAGTVLRVGLIVVSLVGWGLLFASYVRYSRYVRRALNLLAYGIYIVPPAGVGKVLAMNLPVTLTLVGVYVYAQVVNGLFEVSVVFGTPSATNDNAPCTAIFNSDNPSVTAPPTTLRTIGSTVLTMAALFSPSIVALVRMYASPYASVALSNLVVVGAHSGNGEGRCAQDEQQDVDTASVGAGARRVAQSDQLLRQHRQQPYHVGVAGTIVRFLRVCVQLDVIESFLPQYMNDAGIHIKMTAADCFLYVFGIGHTPSQDVFCDQWGDDEASVAAFVQWCSSKGLLGTVSAVADEASPASSSSPTIMATVNRL